MAKTTKATPKSAAQTKAKAAKSIEKAEATTKNMHTLLGSISYENKEDYDKFLASLTLEHAVIVLIAAANFAQAKGIFNLDEAELIAKSIKKLSTKPEPEPAV